MTVQVLQGDCREVLKTLPDQSVHCAVTSPPYFGLRSYLPADHPDKAKEIGAERTPDEYVANLVAVFREARRVLRDDATLWLNLGTSYCTARMESTTYVVKRGLPHEERIAVAKALSSVWGGNASAEQAMQSLLRSGKSQTRELRRTQVSEVLDAVPGACVTGREGAGAVLLSDLCEVRKSDAQAESSDLGLSDVRQGSGTPGVGTWQGQTSLLQQRVLVRAEQGGETPPLDGGAARTVGSGVVDMASSGAVQGQVPVPPVSHDPAAGSPSHPTVRHAQRGSVEGRKRDSSLSNMPSSDAASRDRGGRSPAIHSFGSSHGLADIAVPRSAIPAELMAWCEPESVIKPKDDLMIPHRVYLALMRDGWYGRQEIIWSKPSPMPESVRDRCTKAHESVFLLSKSARYYFDADAIAEPVVVGYAGSSFTKGKTGIHQLSKAGAGDRTGSAGGGTSRGYSKMLATQAVARTGGAISGGTERSTLGVSAETTRNKRSVWTIATQPFSEAHFATMPPELARTCILAGCPEGGTVLDPFGGAGTTALEADRLQRNAISVELSAEYASMSSRRISNDAPLFAEVV